MDKKGKKVSDIVYILLVSTVYLAFALSGMTMIKMGHDSVNGIKIPLIGMISIKTMIGIILYGLGFLVFVFFVSKLKVSVVIPVVSGIYSGVVAVIGVLVFREKLTIGQIIGIVLVVLGTIVVGVFKE